MKLLAFDVDDTLIGPDKILKDTTIASLNERLALGDVIAIVSGRPYVGIMKFLRQLQDGKKYPIGANGAAVYDYEGHCLMVNGLHYSDFLSFYEEHKNIIPYGGSLYCYTLDEVAYFEDSYFIMMERDLNGMKAIDLHKHPLKNDDPILKIMVTFNNNRWDVFKASEEDLKKYHVIRSDPRFLEFTNPTADKASGVEFLRTKLGIEKKDVYCFGDQGNDLGMIAAYQGVAMGNAIPECKKAAKFVTLNSWEDGVSYALHTFVK